MNLNQFIKRHPELKRNTTPEDSRKILAFFKQSASEQRDFALFYDRSPNFFSLSELSSPQFFALSLEDQYGEIRGVASFTLLKSVDFDTLYIGDLKIKTKAEEIKTKWRAFAEDFIENLRDIEEFRNVKFIHMVMMDDNTNAYKRLIASNLLSFKYKKVHNYKMINILAAKWWKSNSKHFFTHVIWKQDQKKIYETIHDASFKKIGSNHPDQMKYRAGQIKDLAKVIEVMDEHGIVIFKATLEDVSTAKRIWIKRLPYSLKLFSFLSPLFRCKKYSENQPLDILYFSNLSFHSSVLKNPEKIAHALNYALKITYGLSSKHYHLISLSAFSQDEALVSAIRKYFIINEESFGFYQILPSWGEKYPHDPLPNFNMSYI